MLFVSAAPPGGDTPCCEPYTAEGRLRLRWKVTFSLSILAEELIRCSGGISIRYAVTKRDRTLRFPPL